MQHQTNIVCFIILLCILIKCFKRVKTCVFKKINYHNYDKSDKYQTTGFVK